MNPETPEAPPDPSKPHPAENTPPRSAKPVTSGILPGMAAIAIYVLFVSMFTAFKMMNQKSMPTSVRYGTLSICTLVVIGVFSMLRLRRWGWALVAGGCLLGAIANFIAFHSTHIGAYLVQGLFALVFFLYLSRTEVRDRLR